MAKQHKVRVGIALTFLVEEDHPNMLLYKVNGYIREFIEQLLPAGWLMQVIVTEVDGEKVENDYV